MADDAPDLEIIFGIDTYRTVFRIRGHEPCAPLFETHALDRELPIDVADGDAAVIGFDRTIDDEQVTEIATGSTGVLAVTGVIAVLTAIWTSIGFVTFTRRAVRDIFGLPFDDRSYVLLKARDFVAALLFGIALVLGSAVSVAGTWALGWIFSLLGWSTASGWYRLGLVSILVSVAVFTGALALLFRFLTGTSLTWRRIHPGGLFGGIALTVLQLGAGWVLRYTPSNPLLATFTIFIGLLLWFRVIGIIILVSASWIAVAASDEDEPLAYLSDADRLREEHAALLLAAQVRLRTARDDRADAPWYRRFAATRAVREAEAELAEVEAAAPAPASRRHTDLFG